MTAYIAHDVYLGLGSNLGNKSDNIHRAIEKINERIGKVISLSSFYETAPVGFFSENYFLNTACHVKTILSPVELLKETQAIEKELGRKTKSENHSYADRIIDIDILMYDDLTLNSESLELPHPHLHEREFVLLPLKEIAPELIHNVLHKTMEELYEEWVNRNL